MSENLLQIEPTIEGSVDSIQQKLAEERIRLMQEAGLEDEGHGLEEVFLKQVGHALDEEPEDKKAGGA